MLIAYYEIDRIYTKNYEIWEEKRPFRLGEEVPKNFISTIDWDTLEYFCNSPKQNWYRVEKRRKGRVFCGLMGALEKEWKNPNFTVMRTTTYMAADPSIMDILNYPNIELAAQYLRERGINIMETVKK